MFYQAVLQGFVHFNKFLQREDPLIPVLHSETQSFVKKLLGRFVKLPAILAAQAGEGFNSLEYDKKENQLPGIFNTIKF